jgi:hypothetical protein
MPTGVTAVAGLYPPHILVEWDTPPDFVQEILVRAKYPLTPDTPLRVAVAKREAIFSE